MTPADQPTPPSADTNSPASFLAAAAALEAIDHALRTARHEDPGPPGPDKVGADQALASLLLLRQVRERLAGWET
ncbi:type III effector protein, partial [Streptomyces sp. NPDC001714]